MGNGNETEYLSPCLQSHAEKKCFIDMFLKGDKIDQLVDGHRRSNQHLARGF